MSVRSLQGGVSLIEILIAVLILSLGILASVSLQLVSKRNTTDADSRALAAHYAYDLTERIRANSRSEALAVYQSAPIMGRGSRQPPAVDCSAPAAACTPTQLALFDLWDWEQLIDGAAEQVDGVNAGGLQSPTVCITGPGGGLSGLYTVTITWRGATAQPNNTANTCGDDLGLYGATNEYRRSATVQAYVASR